MINTLLLLLSSISTANYVMPGYAYGAELVYKTQFEQTSVNANDDIYFFYTDISFDTSIYYNTPQGVDKYEVINYIELSTSVYFQGALEYSTEVTRTYVTDTFSTRDIISIVMDDYNIIDEYNVEFSLTFNLNIQSEPQYYLDVTQEDYYDRTTSHGLYYYFSTYQFDINQNDVDFVLQGFTQAFSYEQGYNDGYDAGEQYGIQQGYATGYTDGFNEGSSLDENTFTIFNGILNIAMVPINFFIGIFNFNILGINISSMVTALLSVCCVVIVIRLVTGKKEE